MKQFAFVFPGQGSQATGMLTEIVSQFPLARDTFQQASQVLGYDLWELVRYGPAEELNKTWRTQPALLTASVAIWRVWLQQGGGMPIFMAGHSLGEYSALVCAGALEFGDAVKLVELRGRLMQEAVPQGVGAMAAVIGLDDAAVVAACHETAGDQVVAAVNFNSPGQVVIAGHKSAVDRAGAACKVAGARRILPLSVSVPSHCLLMRPAAQKLAQQLEQVEISVPKIPVIHNVDVSCKTDAGAIRDALVCQLYYPVQWTKIVEFMAAKSVTRLYEAGPGKVLTGLAKRIVADLEALAVNDSASLVVALEQ